MVRYATDKRSFIKSITFSSAMLFFVSLRAMEAVEPIKEKKQKAKKVRVVDSGLFSQLKPLIPQDVVASYVKKNLGLQEIGRIKQVSKTCNRYWNIHKMCLSPQGCASVCPMLACRQMVAQFDICSTFLAYYAQRNNKKMFKHLYLCDSKKRDEGVIQMLDIKRPILRVCMDVYRGDVFDEAEKIRMRSSKLAEALRNKDKAAVQILLLHKNFGIEGCTGFFDTLLKFACEFGDLEVLFKIIDGVAHINEVDCFGYAAIHYAFKNDNLFSQLMKHGADINKLDREGKTVLFGAVDYNATIADLRKVLLWDPDVNIVCSEGRTVAHDAIIAYKVYDDYDIEKIDLLLGAGIDVRLPNKAGHTFLDYVSNIHGSRKKKALKALLKKHKVKKKGAKDGVARK